MARIEKTIPNFYRDSVALMQLSAQIERLPGIIRATAVMATKANIDLLREAQLITSDIPPRPNDLLIVIEGDDDASAEDARQKIEQALQQAPEAPAGAAAAALPATSLAMGFEDMPDANFALVSTPGEYAAAEAEKALRLGLHTMVFSANVDPKDEIALKRLALDRDLLMMGPDCGTAIVNGVPLGFANVLKRGPVGLVASAGTGLQEVTCLMDGAGTGISQALGCGARDLSEEIGGLSMLQGLDALSDDASTHVIVLIAKHPSSSVARKICDAAATCGKPVVICFLGIDVARTNGDLHYAETLEDAAHLAVALARGDRAAVQKPRAPDIANLAESASSLLTRGQKYIRGLFSGGTFCYEAQVLLAQQLGPVWSNTPVDPAYALSDIWRSHEHTAIDLGDEVFTRGRPHPMIDLRLRLERISKEFSDPETAVILLDVVLGYGAHPDPATEIATAIATARRTQTTKHDVIVVASVCGTTSDPQNLVLQETTLRDAGVLIAPSNAAATRLAAAMVKAGRNAGDAT